MPLILLPNTLGSSIEATAHLPVGLAPSIATLDGLFAENEKDGRKFLKMFKIKKPIQEMPIVAINEHTDAKDLVSYLEPLLKGETWGLVSDAGLPCVADPGASLVRYARHKKIAVTALSGPSSITLSLMLSGMTAQRFYFHGYIAKDPASRAMELKKWQEDSKREKATQVFIETPYRNDHTLNSCLETLADTTRLCVCVNLTESNESVVSVSIAEWKKMARSPLGKDPAIFLFQA